MNKKYNVTLKKEGFDLGRLSMWTVYTLQNKLTSFLGLPVAKGRVTKPHLSSVPGVPRASFLPPRGTAAPV